MNFNLRQRLPAFRKLVLMDLSCPLLPRHHQMMMNLGTFRAAAGRRATLGGGAQWVAYLQGLG